MLLREYILLNLGAASLAEARAWQQDMIKRRQVDACRDLLARWRPAEEQGTVAMLPILGARRFMGELTESEFRAGLEQVLRETLAHYEIATEELTGLGSVETEARDYVLWGGVYLNLKAVQERFERVLDYRAVGNAMAFFFEQTFGFAPAAKHPVAYEESLRPTEGV